MRLAAAPLAFHLFFCAAALAEDELGCSIGLARTGADGVGTYAAECRWPVAASYVTAIVGESGKLAEVTSAVAESTKLPDGRLVNVIQPGWPIDDRQSTLLVERTALPDGGLVLSYTLAPVQAPLGKGRVQTLRDDGRWEIHPDGSGGTRLRYENTYDAGGSLPASLVQRAIPDRMARSLAEVRGAAEANARAARTRTSGR
jgi:hypothetical protein